MSRYPLRTLASATALAMGASMLAALPAQAADPIEIQLLGINDFHGRIWSAPDNQLAGRLASKVEELREANPNTVFLSSGDNIGASTFESFIAYDNPTIDVLNAMGLEVSAVGNHEFDRGFADLLDRIPTEFGGVEDLATDRSKTVFPYLGANVYNKGTDAPALQEYYVLDVGGVSLGFVGLVTSETSTLVAPAGIAGVDFGDPLPALNRVAAQLSDGNEGNGEADIVVALVHDGSDNTDCSAIATEATNFGGLVRDASSDVDVIFSAHTHRVYQCEIGGRQVIQAGSYATHLAQVVLSVDPDDGSVRSATSGVVLVNGSGAPAIVPTPSIVELVNAAVTAAEGPGSQVVANITADITRASAGGAEDRGSESSLGSLVADMQLWATSENPNYGGTPTQIAFMNPGGLRADLLYGSDGSVTYKQAALVQPFANTLVTMTLTGAQIRQVLEEQWQPEGASRPRLALGISKGLSYTYVADAARGSHVVDITFNGAPLDESASYRVVVNSFLASGGDNFTTLSEGADVSDSGQVDLQAAVDYFAAHSSVSPPALGRSSVVDPPAKEIANLTAPKITGKAVVGQTLKADPGTWSETGVSFAYEWKLNGTAIKGASSSSYKVAKGDAGKKLTVTVTAAKEGFTSASATSKSVTVKAKTVKNTSKPKITGKAAVGHKVKASSGTWSEKGLTYSYQWKLNGKKIKGATKSAYTVPTSAKGKKLTVTVTASAVGVVTTSATSKSVTVKAKPIKNTSKPKITGKAKVGNVVKAKPGTWSEKGLKYRYQWKLNGKPIKEATESSYKLTWLAKGKKLTVTVTASRSGYVSAKATSKSVKVGKR
ncbi:5'-nucleotidase C-terminal domain-containing protein [Tessaracoccus caeni]|uniref:5'-nucleotidase C-terminal domain-containing protein n=1 Tax=Tessaracoccus caeni TaxID=3031239 RepID=UPI0023DC0417|nr:5'-nucleotidase C-terminal domain-containing protein [Tessaracoccus caeni]MDF1488843.1 5'-nucleotidase C-terminal domain-containing protein [Tessaracoccus caeni]